MEQSDSKLPEVDISIFSVMSKMAADHNAINLSQGFPDFEIDPQLSSLVHEHMVRGHNQYAPMPGVPQLQLAIAEVLKKEYQCTLNAATEITVTAGATEALFSAIAAFVKPGDEVIIFDPAYDSYNPAVRINGGIPIHINLVYPDFSIDWDLVRSKITARTKMIIVNTPHNPCSALLKHEDLLELERIVLHYNLILLSDEVYERLVFDNRKHHSVLRYPQLAAHSLIVFSFGKTFHATGWKVGYIVGPQHLMREVRKVHQFIVFCVNTPVQLALAAYLEDANHYLQLASFYEQKRDFFLEQIKGSSLEPLPCNGSYFQILSFKNVSRQNDLSMAEELTKKFKVASIPVSPFYQDKTDNHLLRFCFAKKDETLGKAGEILRKI